MPTADIHIVRRGDPPPWEDVENPSHYGGPIGFAVLEGGMASGLPSVAVRLPLPDGSTMIAETSLQLLAGVVIAARAAFPDAFSGGPLDPEGRS
jgi:hypothetical protein